MINKEKAFNKLYMYQILGQNQIQRKKPNLIEMSVIVMPWAKNYQQMHRYSFSTCFLLLM